MFGQLRMIFTLLVIAGIAGAGMYVVKLRADNVILKANQIQLEQSIKSQAKVLAQQKKDFEKIMKANKEMNQLVDNLQEDMRQLDKRFTKKEMIEYLKKINFSKIEVLDVRDGLFCKVSKE